MEAPGQLGYPATSSGLEKNSITCSGSSVRVPAEAMRTSNGTQSREARGARSKADATLKRAAEKYQATREAIVPAAVKWCGERGGDKGTSADRALTHVVRAHIKAREHLEGLLGSQPARKERGSGRR